jgi:hypothetical protein
MSAFSRSSQLGSPVENIRLRARSAGALIAALLFFCCTFAAAEPTAEDRETARTLLFDGRKKMVAKDYESALKSFRAAHAIMAVPTTGLDVARAQEALHLLIEARETALSVVKIPVQTGESIAFASARTAAAELASTIGPRIPALLIIVNGMPPGAEPSVVVDGTVLPAASVGFPRKLNPGKHTVQVTAPGLTLEKRDVDLREGDAHTETIELKPGTSVPTKDPGPSRPGAPAAPPTPPSTSPPAAVPPAPEKSSDSEGRKAPVWAWVSGGVGLVGLGVSAGFLVDHLDARQTAQRDCPMNVCDPNDPKNYTLEKMDRLRGRWNRDLGISVAVGAVSLAALGAAAVGIFSGPKSPGTKTSLHVAPWGGPAGGGVDLTGSF